MVRWANMASALKRNILIFHTGALGDFVLSWPLALALSRLHPQSRILYITHPSKGQLSSRFIGTEAASFETGGWHTLFSDSLSLPAAAQQILQKTQAIYSFLSAPSDAFSRGIASLAPDTPLHHLQLIPPADFPNHVTAFYQQQLAHLPALVATCTQLLQFVTQQGIATHRRPADRILLHPGSGSQRKCWPADRFIELANALKSDGHSVALLLGEVESERLDDSTLARLQQTAPLLRPETYLQLADELLAARLLITNDNGPGHLAGILGTPTLSLFGPTNPAQWRPLGPRTAVLHSRDLANLPATEVRQITHRCLEAFTPTPAPATAPADDDEP